MQPLFTSRIGGKYAHSSWLAVAVRQAYVVVKQNWTKTSVLFIVFSYVLNIGFSFLQEYSKLNEIEIVERFDLRKKWKVIGKDW